MATSSKQVQFNANEQQQDSSKPSSSSSFAGWKEGAAGTISGFGKVVAGYPFDTVKGRVQSGRFNTSMEALIGTVRNEGFFALYQGVIAPTVNVCFVGGILFYFNGYLRKMIQPEYPQKSLTYSEMFLAGSGAGFVVGVVVNPIEVLKLRMQMINKREVKDASHAKFRYVLKQAGWKNMGCGITPTIIREMGTFGIFFPCNEYLKIQFQRVLDGVDPTANNGDSSQSIPPPSFTTRVAAAGFAGVVCWLPLYPVDQIKSKMQLDGVGVHRSTIHCGIDILKKEGVRHGFFKGIAPCLIRAFPAYAAQFLLYEKMVNVLNTV